MSGARITVVGSINLDMVATAASLPAPGETVTGATLARHPGGKGANQALAARRLGAEVSLIGGVGQDPFAEEALTLLRAGGVDLSGVRPVSDEATGVALIAVDRAGENQIVVAAGANFAVTPADLPMAIEDALICQLELPIAVVEAAVERAEGFVCLNLAPATAVSPRMLARADLIVVNETEAAFYGSALKDTEGLVALTLGARGAALYRRGELLAKAVPPKVAVVDTTGAGDVFVGALVTALLEDPDEARGLAFACAAGAAAVTRAGAQTSAPTRAEVDALARQAMIGS